MAMGVFKMVVTGLFAAILASYNGPRGEFEWTTRYTELVALSPIDDPAVVRLPPHPPAKGVYKHNDKLQSLTKLGEGELLQPEDVQPDPTGTFLYVTNADGWIRKYYFDTAKVENWTYVGGRPLGLALDSTTGSLIVCEPTKGQLLQISTDNGKITVLSTEAEGVKYKIIDEVIVASDGLIYFTDGSYKYPLTTWWYDILEGKPHGRVLVYDPKEKTTSVVVKNLRFANGVALSKSEDYLLYCESTMARVTKLWLKGSKKGKTEVFIDNLPGLPDNIHRNKAGDRFYLCLLFNRDALFDFMYKTPVLKHLLAWDEKLYTLYDNSRYIARVVELDEKGKPLRVFEDSTGKVIAKVTTAVPSNDGKHIYVGGLQDNFVGRYSLPK